MFSHTTRQKLAEIKRSFPRIAQNIFIKNHLRPFNGSPKEDLFELPVERISHGAHHASRVAIYIRILVNYCRSLGYPKEIIDLTEEQITLLQLTALYQDVVRKSDREGGGEKQSAERFKRFLVECGINDEAALAYSRYIENDRNHLLLQAANSLDSMRVRRQLPIEEINLYQQLNKNDRDSFLQLAKEIRSLIAGQYDLKCFCKIIENEKVIFNGINATRDVTKPALKQDYEQAANVYEKVEKDLSLKKHSLLSRLYCDNQLFAIDPVLAAASAAAPILAPAPAEKIHVAKFNIPKATYERSGNNKIHLLFPSNKDANDYLNAIGRRRPYILAQATIANLSTASRLSLAYGNWQSLRSELRKQAPTFAVPDRFYYKAIRANTTCYFHTFSQELAVGKKNAKRIVPKDQITVTGKGFFSRSLVSNEIAVKNKQYSTEEKEHYTSSQSTSLGLKSYFPPVFRFGKHEVSAGVMFNESSVRLSDRLYVIDSGTAHRPYDHYDVKTAEDYAKSKIGKALFSADKLDEFIKAIQTFSNRGNYNEVLARLKYDNNVRTFIGADNLESRLIAKQYADSLARELYKQGKCSKEHKVPVCFYTPDNAELSFKEYTQAEYEMDGIEATHIYFHKRHEYYKRKKYEFLLGLDNSIVSEALDEAVNGRTVLMGLLKSGYVHIFRFLHEKGNKDLYLLLMEQIATTAFSENTYTKILFHALMSGDEKLANIIFDRIAIEKNVYSSHFIASFFLAIERNQVAFVKKFLESNSDLVTMKNKQGNCPLTLASYHGHAEIVELLLQHRADVNASGSTFTDYKTRVIHTKHAPIALAASYGHSKVVDALLKKGADTCSLRQGYILSRVTSPLVKAASRGHIECVKLLLPTATVGQKDLAFIQAATKGMANVVGFLLHQASEVARNEALNCAVKEGHKQIADVLAKHDACSKAKQKALDICHESRLLKPRSNRGVSGYIAGIFKRYSQFSLFQWRHHRTLANTMAEKLYSRDDWSYAQCAEYIRSQVSDLKINERGTFAALLRKIENIYEPKMLAGPIDLIGRRP